MKSMKCNRVQLWVVMSPPSSQIPSVVGLAPNLEGQTDLLLPFLCHGGKCSSSQAVLRSMNVICHVALEPGERTWHFMKGLKRV